MNLKPRNSIATLINVVRNSEFEPRKFYTSASMEMSSRGASYALSRKAARTNYMNMYFATGAVYKTASSRFVRRDNGYSTREKE